MMTELIVESCVQCDVLALPERSLSAMGISIIHILIKRSTFEVFLRDFEL
jgi:hypothetical protein